MYMTNIRRAQSVAQAVRVLVTERAGASLMASYPIDMESVAQAGLEIPVTYLRNLTVSNSEQYICLYRGDPDWRSEPAADRPLYGLLYVGRPSALIMLDAGLPDAVRNYVLAHEIGHYLADMMLVQEAWLRAFPDAGSLVRQAFDWGLLDPHLELRALLRSLPQRPQPIMARGSGVGFEVPSREIAADLIARELMAPWSELGPYYETRIDAGVPRAERITTAVWQLTTQYNLPSRISTYYAADLERVLAPAPDIIERLFGSVAQRSERDDWAIESAEQEEDY